MPYPFATQVHTRFRLRNRRITPGVMLTTTAIAVVVLFLATVATARADAPGDAGPTSGDCAGFSPIVLTANDANFGNTNRIERSQLPSASNCALTLAVTRQERTSQGDAANGASGASGHVPCVITLTPRNVTGNGAAGTVSSSGNCGGLTIAWTVNVAPRPEAALPPEPAAASRVAGAASSSPTAYAKITGDDFFGIDVFSHYVRVVWTYTRFAITSSSHTTGGGPKLPWWHQQRQNDRIIRHNSTRHEAYDQREWYTGLAPSGNTTRATLIVRPEGLYNCRYSTNPDAGWDQFALDLDYECRREW